MRPDFWSDGGAAVPLHLLFIGYKCARVRLGLESLVLIVLLGWLRMCTIPYHVRTYFKYHTSMFTNRIRG